MKFKEWDRVLVDVSYLGVCNEKGTVLGNTNDCGTFQYCVRLDNKDMDIRHTCGGLCEDGYGLSVLPRHLTLITNKEA